MCTECPGKTDEISPRPSATHVLYAAALVLNKPINKTVWTMEAIVIKSQMHELIFFFWGGGGVLKLCILKVWLLLFFFFTAQQLEKLLVK